MQKKIDWIKNVSAIFLLFLVVGVFAGWYASGSNTAKFNL